MEIPRVLKFDASDGIESCPVAVEDGIDLSKFKYCKVNIPGPGCDLEMFNEQFEGCQCSDICTERSCSCLLRYGQIYDNKGRLPFQTSEFEETKPVLECNKCCKCSKKCSRRVVQLGVTRPLEIFLTPLKGHGLRTLEYIHQNSFVCEYAGEVISLAEARKRAELQKQTDKNYILVLNEMCGSTADTVWRTCIDPQYIGNVGRFINHSCEPNLFMVPVRVNNNIPKLSLFASRTIEPGEELTFSYAGEGFNDNDGSKSDVELNETDFKGITQIRLKKCMCGSMSCEGYLPYDTSLFTSLDVSSEKALVLKE